MRRAVPSLLPLLVLCGCLSSGPPDLPLSPGAEAVEVRDSDTIKKRPIDTTKCRAIESVHVGPVSNNNLEVALKNEAFGKGGNFFYGTSYQLWGGMWSVTGTVYDCPSLKAAKPPVTSTQP
jgi:hypothetical protein